MEVVIGIAAKSLDAAFELAKALHGSRAWGHERAIGLGQPCETENPAAPAVPAQARLLISQDFRTAYVLVATHAPAADLLRAAAAAVNTTCAPGTAPLCSAAALAPQSDGLTEAPREGAKQQLLQSEDEDDDADGEGTDGRSVRASSSSSSTNRRTQAAAGGTRPLPSPLTVQQPPPAVPPLQRLQQLHGAAVNALLLQLFMACDVVLAVLPTGQGLGSGDAGGGAGGGPLPGISDWVARLRLLQGARRALHQAVATVATSDSKKTNVGSAQQRGRSLPNQDQAGAPQSGSLSPDLGIETLKAWCGRPAPPVLLFVAPSDPTLATPATQRDATRGPGAAAGPTSGDPRDASSLVRSLIKRCRPVSAPGSNEPWALCSFDAKYVVLDPGPLALSPAQIHATVLAALLGADGDGAGGDAVAAVSVAEQLGFAGGEGCGGDLQVLRQAVSAALREVAGVAVAEGGGHGATWRLGAEAEAMPVVSAGSTGGAGAVAMLVAERFGAGWRVAASQLFAAAAASWHRTAGQSLDWVSPHLAGVAPGSRNPAGSRADPSQSSTRGRVRTPPQPTPADSSSSAAAAAAPQLPSLEPVGAWLAVGGGGLGARLAAELCQGAADTALRQYTYGMPPRYPARVHAAAVAGAVAALRAAAPPGPAVGAAVAALRAACDEAWRGGRQQCSALSTTGRPCTRPPHGPSEPHGSEAVTWVSATTTGSALVSLPDAFDLQEANTAPRLDDGKQVAAAAPPQPAAAAPPGPAVPGTTGRPKKSRPPTGDPFAASSQSAAAPAAPKPPDAPPAPPPHSRHLVVAMAQGPDGTTNQCALGPWVTVTRLGPASAYSERRGLANQPGLQGAALFPLTLPMGGGADAAPGQRQALAGSALGAGRGGRVAGRGSAAVTAAGLDTSDAGLAAGGSDGEVVLDEQSFPSLAAAVAKTATRPGAVAGPGGPAPRRGAKQAAAGGKAPTVDPAVALAQERESLARVWPYPYGGGGGREGRIGGGSAATGGDAQRSVAQGDGRGRRTRGSAGVAAASRVDPAAFPSLQGARDVRKVYIAYEYQTLDGRRFLATPSQLAAASPASAFTAAGTFAASASATGPSPRARSTTPTGRHGPDARTSRALRAPGATAASSSTLAATALGSGSSSGNAAAAYLIQHDAPLFLQPPPGLQPDTQAPSFQDDAPGWDPTPRRPSGLAQLQRIHLVTPASTSGEALLAVRPTVHFRLVQPPQLPADAVPCGEERDGSRVPVSAEVVTAPAPAVGAVQVTLARPVVLPPDSLVVVSLPFAYGLPADWLGWAGHGTGGSEGWALQHPQADAGGDGLGVGMAAAAPGGGSNTGGLSLNGSGGPASLAKLIPLVQLEQRLPFEAHLVAGSAVFPIHVPAKMM